MDEAIFILKPGFLVYEKQVAEYTAVHGLKIIERRNKVLSRTEIVCLYPEIFTKRDDDSQFGQDWKYDSIEYLSSGRSIIYRIRGQGSSEKMKTLKKNLRNIEKKEVIPPHKLSREEFINTSIKNVAHTVDADEFTQILWLFNFSTRDITS